MTEPLSPPYRYLPSVLEALAAHGVRPTASTAPDFVREFLNDLYRYELRRLRAELLAGAFPKPEYFDRVVALRRRYPLLSLKPWQWLDEAPARRAGN
jgi:hypothetical protein